MMETLATITGYLLWAALAAAVIAAAVYVVGVVTLVAYRRVRLIWWYHHRSLLRELHGRSTAAISEGDESPALHWINRRLHKAAVDIGREQWGVAMYLKPRAKR